MLRLLIGLVPDPEGENFTTFVHTTTLTGAPHRAARLHAAAGPAALRRHRALPLREPRRRRGAPPHPGALLPTPTHVFIQE